MPSKFDYEDMRRKAVFRGLMDMGARLMQASGPSFKPQSTFSRLGQGAQGFSQGIQQGMQGGMQQQMMQAKMAQAQREQKLAEGLRGSLPKDAPPWMQHLPASALGQGLMAQRAAKVGQESRTRERIAGQEFRAGESAKNRSATYGAAAAANKARLEAARIKASAVSGTRSRKFETTLRKEFTSQSKDFRKSVISYDKVKSSLGLKSSFGDHSAIFSYMKVLDPTSTIREGEFATVEKTRGWSDIWRNLYNKALKGQKLTQTQRTEMLKATSSLHNQAINAQLQRREQYTGLSTRGRADPSQVVIDFGAGPQSIPRISGDADYDKIPKGERYVGPDGKIRVKR